jgi:hypothetical protein
MSDPLPLYPGAKTCVQSGYCCTQAPCPFGTWDHVAHQCTELVWEADGTSRCNKYAEILARPERDWWLAPAFGAGCCSPLGNKRRDRILLKLVNHKDTQ